MGGSGRDVPGGWLTYMSGTCSQLLGAWTAPGTTLTVTALPPAIVLASYPVTPDAQKSSERVSDYRPLWRRTGEGWGRGGAAGRTRIVPEEDLDVVRPRRRLRERHLHQPGNSSARFVHQRQARASAGERRGQRRTFQSQGVVGEVGPTVMTLEGQGGASPICSRMSYRSPPIAAGCGGCVRGAERGWSERAGSAARREGGQGRGRGERGCGAHRGSSAGSSGPGNPAWPARPRRRPSRR